MHRQTGVTLIEMLLVLAVIGLIGAITIPALIGQRARTKDRGSVANLTTAMGDLVSSYDRALENGDDPVKAVEDRLASSSYAQQKNPWNPSSPAFVYGTPSGSMGEVGIVYTAPTGTDPARLTGTVILKISTPETTGSGPYLLTKVVEFN